MRTWTKRKGEESTIYDFEIDDLSKGFEELDRGTGGASTAHMDAEELRERTMRFAIRAVKFCRTLPDTWETRRIGGQLIDSATSVAMNYRSAGRGRSRAEFIAKLGIVVEEADESAGWLELIARLELSKMPESSWLLGESRELLAIFAKSQKTARDNLRIARSASRPVKRGLQQQGPDREPPD